jgi:Flp pilus assembly protein TadG
MFFGLAAIPLLVAVGAGLDTARINREHTTFNAAVDTAAITVAADVRSADAANTAVLRELAKKVIASNYSPEQVLQGDVTVDVTITGSDIKVDANLDFPTAIMKLFGVENINLKSSSTVTKAMRPIELVLVMDTTGSMNGSVNGQTKLYWAQQGARDLLTRIYGGSAGSKPRSEYLRVGLVPFAAAVRVSPPSATAPPWVDVAGVNPISRINFDGTTLNNFNAWAQLRYSGTSTPLTWNGCVEARRRGNPTLGEDYNANDAAPTPTVPDTLFPAYFAPDLPGINSHNSYRPVTSTGGTLVSGAQDWRNRGLNSNNYIFENSSGATASTATNVVTSGETATMTTAQKADLGTATTTQSPKAVTVLRNRMRNSAKYIGAQVASTEGSGTNSNSGPWRGCPVSTVVPMTYDRASIEAGINAMVSRGPTNIAEGLAWGMRVISPGEPFSTVSGSGSISSAPIATYNNPRWQKVMLLMTDGDNDLAPGLDRISTGSSSSDNYFNNIYTQVADISYSANGYPGVGGALNRFAFTNVYQAEESLNDDVLSVCERIKSDKNTLDTKDDNVTLYVTSFGSGVSPDTQNLLRDCATTPAPGQPAYYQHSVTGADLSAFFDHVGQDVLNKMVFVSK